MKGFLYIDAYLVGEIDFRVIDESMGVIGGNMIPTSVYRKYQDLVRECFEINGVCNGFDFNFRVLLEDGIELIPEGGICITDSKEFGEILVDCAGLDLKLLNGLSDSQDQLHGQIFE